MCIYHIKLRFFSDDQTKNLGTVEKIAKSQSDKVQTEPSIVARLSSVKPNEKPLESKTQVLLDIPPVMGLLLHDAVIFLSWKD